MIRKFLSQLGILPSIQDTKPVIVEPKVEHYEPVNKVRRPSTSRSDPFAGRRWKKKKRLRQLARAARKANR